MTHVPFPPKGKSHTTSSSPAHNGQKNEPNQMDNVPTQRNSSSQTTGKDAFSNVTQDQSGGIIKFGMCIFGEVGTKLSTLEQSAACNLETDKRPLT
jgi:hypothetical protein